MTVEERPTAGFVLSIIAGLLILVGSGTAVLWFSGGVTYGGRMMGGMMYDWRGMMSGVGLGTWFLGMTLVGLVSGILILLGAFMLYSQPKQALAWGTVVLVFSVLSFFGMGGFFLGGILGIVGGILAMTWKQVVTRP